MYAILPKRDMTLPESTLKDLFLKSKVVDSDTLASLEEFAASSRTSLQEVIIQKGILTDEDLGAMIAQHLQIPFAVISKMSISDDIFPVIPERLARKHKLIAFDGDQSSIKLGM